jgi:hypothetical protein
MTNPFAPASIIDEERGVFADGAVRRQAFFVHRSIEFTRPIAFDLVYDGWWFRQVVKINGTAVWWRISWTTFYKRIDFNLPKEVDSACSPVRIDIRFGQGLLIRRFQVSIAGQIVYDEIV